MTQEQAIKLAYPFSPEEIEWRVLRTNKDKTKGQVAAYVTSRAIQTRLDAVLGRENWKNEFQAVQGANSSTTTYICKLSIYYPDRQEWIPKSDGAGGTDVEPVKGGLSNAFKRAASMWNIGRYLYDLKNIWAKLDEYKAIQKEERPRLDELYVQYVRQYLTAQKSRTEKPEQPPAAQPSAPAPVQPVTDKPQTGRFEGTNAPPPKPARDTFEVTDLRVTKGGSGTQTLIRFQSSEGREISGYIQGIPALKTGQFIRAPKIITKESPVVGKYNIIESFEIAA